MKKILFVVGGLVVLLVVAAVVLIGVAPTDFAVEREVVINKPRAEVFAYIKLLKNQNTWGPWEKKDPTMEHEYRGTDGEVGFVSAWESDNNDVGSGEQEIMKITEGERVDVQLRFKKPFESTSDAYLTTESAGDNATKVKWGFTGSMPVPFNVMMLFIDMEAAVGKDFDEGLSSLKAILEKEEPRNGDSE